VRKAVEFAIDVHEVKRHQKRKGKEIPYITHPLTVGLILAKAGADEDTIVAGLLHETVEESLPDFAVTEESLQAEFGDRVAWLIDSVTELSKELPWHERNNEALARIAEHSQESLLIKCADVLTNDWDLVEDIGRDGEKVFDRFNVSKEERLLHQFKMISALMEEWPGSPLAHDLNSVEVALRGITRANPHSNQQVKPWL